jgi:hypothetical protein
VLPDMQFESHAGEVNAANRKREHTAIGWLPFASDPQNLVGDASNETLRLFEV